jgi:hypothetical protein
MRCHHSLRLFCSLMAKKKLFLKSNHILKAQQLLGFLFFFSCLIFIRMHYAMDDQKSQCEPCGFCFKKQRVPVASVEVCDNEIKKHTMHIACLAKMAKKYSTCPECSYKLSLETLQLLNIRLPRARVNLLERFLHERERVSLRIQLRFLATGLFAASACYLFNRALEGETVQPSAICIMFGGVCGMFLF